MLVFMLVVPAAKAQVGNVIYTAQDRQGEQSIFLDRSGDLYPPAAVPVDRDGMLGLGLPRHEVTEANVATLRAHFERQSRLQSPAWLALLRASAVTPRADFADTWDRIQAKFRDETVARLNRSRQQELVFLVHGFNNTQDEASAWMDPVAQRMQRRRPSAQIVKVYWDGLQGNRWGVGIWSKAQFNGPRTGQGFRRILSDLGSDHPVRIFTHSSGAYMITNALGDGGASFNRFRSDPVVAARAGGRAAGYALPFNLTDLRVAMLIPAQPWTAFNAYADGSGVVPERLILGTSRRDIAASKAMLPCNWFGNSCMAVKPEKACAAAQKALGAARAAKGKAPASVIVVDFPKPANRRYHEHAVEAYAADRVQWDEMMQQLFDDAPEPPHGPSYGCSGARLA